MFGGITANCFCLSSESLRRRRIQLSGLVFLATLGAGPDDHDDPDGKAV
jgi:hypothetical protein